MEPPGMSERLIEKEPDMRRHLFGLMVCCCALAGAAACSKNSSCASPTSPSCGNGGSSGAVNNGNGGSVGNGGGTTAKPLTQTQINQVSAAVSPAISLAFSKMSTALTNTSFAIKARAKDGRVHTESTSFPFSGSAACDSGGSISVSGALVDATNSQGSGTVSMNMTVGLSSCVEAGVKLQGNPNISFSGSFNFSNFDLVNPATFSLGGGFLFTLDGVTGSATYSCNETIDVNTFTVSDGGTVTLQYPVGQNSTPLSCSGF
jgi:hypothetical protein